VYAALVHYPILGRDGAIIATAITNVDLHDICRSGRTYGLRGVFFVTPVQAQLKLASSILDHWKAGDGKQRNTARSEAFSLSRTCATIEDAKAAVTSEQGQAPEVVVTSAQFGGEAMSFPEYRQHVRAGGRPQLLLFGTGWGLVDETIAAADIRLASVRSAPWAQGGKAPYNHLSVRSAVAIILDRVFGDLHG
jgi:hypothetical protein